MSVATDAPASDVDPFSNEFFEDPHRIHEELREAGPVVWLSRYGIYAVARYAEVHAVLNDWRTFCSSRGVGMDDFAKETPWRPRSLVLETDPPEHDRARAVLNRVLSPAAMKRLREGFAAAAERKVDELLERGSFDAITDLAEAYPAVRLPRRGRHAAGGARARAALRRPRLQRLRPGQRAPARRRWPSAAPHVAWVTESVPARERWRRAASAPGSTPPPTPARSRRRRRRCWSARCSPPGWTPR